ncbi:MAG: HAD family phosphatase [Pirellulales bacterium]
MSRPIVLALEELIARPMPQPELSAVVFDMDGLMFNTEELYQDVGAIMLRRRGREWTQELLDAMMGRPTPVAMGIMIEHHGLDDTVEALSQETNEIFLSILDDRLEPLPGLFELLEALEAHGVPKAIATSSGRAFVENVLGRFDLVPRFNDILTSESVTHGKPHPEVYLKAAASLGHSPPAVLVLEDSENGCRAAIDAGTFAVAVPGDHSRDHNFTGAALVADSLADERIYQALGIAQCR